MKSFFSILLSLFFLSLFSQDCKPDQTIVDDFTEEETDVWGGKLGSAGSLFLQGVKQHLSVYAYEKENDLFIELVLSYRQGESDASVNLIEIPEGSKFYLKTDEKILSFTAKNVYTKKRKLSNATYTFSTLLSEMKESDLDVLSHSEISMFRVIPLDREKIEGDVKQNKSNHLLSQFNCLKKKLIQKK